MSQVIRISDDVFKRLESLAYGFDDTPSTVIEKLLNACGNELINLNTGNNVSIIQEAQPTGSLEIVYFADSEEDFKQQLLSSKKAYIKLYYTNGTSEIKEWDATRFSATSSVNGNLRSGYLRGWKDKGISKAELSINLSEIT